MDRKLKFLLAVLLCLGCAAAEAQQVTVNRPSTTNLGSTATIGANSTVYTFAGVGGGAGETNNQFTLAKAGTITDLYVIASPAPGGTATLVATARKNAAPGSTTCTITGTATSCSNNTPTTFAAGDALTFQFVNAAGSSTTRFYYGYTIATPQ